MQRRAIASSREGPWILASCFLQEDYFVGLGAFETIGLKEALENISVSVTCSDFMHQGMGA